MKKNIYRIDHFYLLDHNENCVMVESNINLEQMIRLLAAMEFKFEELVDYGVALDPWNVLILLEKFFGAKNIKDKYINLSGYELHDRDWELVNIFELKENIEIIQIDLYSAREYYCGEYKEVMIELEEILEENLEEFNSEIIKLKDSIIE